ncbi:hypothetical protein CGZ95_08915 [Enemella evansiae]|uniref:TraM recognition domain-containing protein n=1 Tax=Enemella evansiae TaxID=2016499 RepID=UPI000B9783F2|nr:TraM recognition domain-containing protein [Enemella evansiae]OYO00733.1 hypothetical protein CGZ95_08915 [Enemella evansiae]
MNPFKTTKAAAPPKPVPEKKEKQVYVPPPTPFGGFIDGVPAETAPHLLVSGVSGSGKSRRVLAPGILMWSGPVCAVSSKPDLVELCLAKRVARGGKGRTYILDLSGEVRDETLPEGVERVVIDPTALVTNSDEALDIATILLQNGSAGAGGSNGGSSGGDGTAEFFETLSTAPLAAILLAAGSDGMSWARSAVSRLMGTSEDDLSPSWTNAVERLREVSPMLADELLSASTQDVKQVSNIQITMKAAVAPWLRSTVLGSGHERAFTPAMLEHRAASLFIVAPATGVAAGAAVSCASAIAKRWRANQTEAVKLPRLLLTVDELCNTMPWQDLPNVVTESRAMGIHLLCAVQATSQLELRYGSAGMTALRDTWPAVLCLVGAPEKEMFEAAAWWYGETEQQKSSTDHLGKQSHSGERVEAFQGSDLLPRSINEGRLLRGRRPGLSAAERDKIHEAGLLVTLVDIDAIPFRIDAA